MFDAHLCRYSTSSKWIAALHIYIIEASTLIEFLFAAQQRIILFTVEMWREPGGSSIRPRKTTYILILKLFATSSKPQSYMFTQMRYGLLGLQYLITNVSIISIPSFYKIFKGTLDINR